MGPTYGKRAAVALAIAPLFLPYLLIALFGVDMLLWDEYSFTDFVRSVREGGDWLPWLWRQHNEHRIVATKLVMVPNALFLHWSRIAEMYVSAVLSTLVVLGLWRVYRRSGGSGLLAFAPVAWLACSLAQYENLLYGMMTCHWFTVLGVIWGLVCLDRRGAAGFALAVFFALLASFSVLNGLLIWPAGLFLLLACGRWRASAGWLAAGVATVALYLNDFHMPAGRLPADLSATLIARISHYALTTLGAPLAAGSMAWGFVAGCLLAALALAAAFGWWRSGWERLREEALPAALFLFGFLSCAMVAAGRVATAIPALQPRYITYASLAVIGAYLLVCQGMWRRGETPATSPRFAAAFCLLALGVAAANLHGLEQAREWRRIRLRDRFLLQTFDRQRDQDLRLYDLAQLRRMAPYLRDERLGPFAHPPNLLLLIQWQEGTLPGEVLPGREIEQTIVCPVPELHDVALTFATYGRPNASHVLLTVESGGRRLATRKVPAAELLASSWFEIPLDEPLRGCQGREIRIRVEAPDAVPGDAVAPWTYPPYYQGVLRQGKDRIDGRSLGVMLNGFHVGLL